MTVQANKKRDWRKIGKLSTLALVAAGVAFLVGLYAISPYFQRGAETYVPERLATMPASLITITNPDDTSVVLLVRVASTADARTWGLRQVGPAALATTLLLYDQTRERTTSTTYNMQGLRAPLELAVIQVDGTVSSVQRVAQDAASAVVEGRHRWVLAAREGLLASMGIVVDSQLHVEQIRQL